MPFSLGADEKDLFFFFVSKGSSSKVKTKVCKTKGSVNIGPIQE